MKMHKAIFAHLWLYIWGWCSFPPLTEAASRLVLPLEDRRAHSLPETGLSGSASSTVHPTTKPTYTTTPSLHYTTTSCLHNLLILHSFSFPVRSSGRTTAPYDNLSFLHKKPQIAFEFAYLGSWKILKNIFSNKHGNFLTFPISFSNDWWNWGQCTSWHNFTASNNFAIYNLYILWRKNAANICHFVYKIKNFQISNKHISNIDDIYCTL